MNEVPRSNLSAGRKLSTISTVIVIIVVAIVAMRRNASGTGGTVAPGLTGAAATARPPAKSTDANPANSAAAAAATIRIGAWNMEWLGQPDKRSGHGMNTAQSPEDMADYIVASGVSVLAVEEIVGKRSGGAGGPRSAELDAALAAVERRTGDAWRSELFAGRGEGDQLTGVAWNPRVVSPTATTGAVGWRMPIKEGRGPQGSGLWNRPPHAVQFSAGSGRTDFTVVVVHMKADYKGDFASHRAMEARVLAEALPETRRKFHDQDVVVLGDTNMTTPTEEAKGTIEGAGLVDLNAKSEATHWRGGATDRIFVPTDQPEFSPSERRFEVMSDRYLEAKRWEPREFKRRLSDHFMVVTTVTVMADDD